MIENSFEYCKQKFSDILDVYGFTAELRCIEKPNDFPYFYVHTIDKHGDLLVHV